MPAGAPIAMPAAEKILANHEIGTVQKGDGVSQSLMKLKDQLSGDEKAQFIKANLGAFDPTKSVDSQFRDAVNTWGGKNKMLDLVYPGDQINVTPGGGIEVLREGKSVLGINEKILEQRGFLLRPRVGGGAGHAVEKGIPAGAGAAVAETLDAAHAVAGSPDRHEMYGKMVDGMRVTGNEGWADLGGVARFQYDASGHVIAMIPGAPAPELPDDYLEFFTKHPREVTPQVKAKLAELMRAAQAYEELKNKPSFGPEKAFAQSQMKKLLEEIEAQRGGYKVDVALLTQHNMREIVGVPKRIENADSIMAEVTRQIRIDQALHIPRNIEAHIDSQTFAVLEKRGIEFDGDGIHIPVDPGTDQWIRFDPSRTAENPVKDVLMVSKNEYISVRVMHADGVVESYAITPKGQVMDIVVPPERIQTDKIEPETPASQMQA